MTSLTAELAAPLARYARRLHDSIGPGHTVVSPLGAWLLLALCGPACRGEERTQVADALGRDIETAAGAAGALLSQPHPLVAAAAAAWQRAGADTTGLGTWLAGLPAAVTQGEIPGQEALDAWAREHTLGLIGRFPLRVSPDTLLVLASALAVKVSWAQPFDIAPASALGEASPWARQLTRVLRTPARGHTQFIAETGEAGDVAVHAARGRDGLLVVSVAAAAGVAPVDVLAAAHEVGAALARENEVTRRSLFDLPLGEGPAGEGPLWTVTERPGQTTAWNGREERCQAVLPAWTARGEHDLDRDALGFPAAAAALTRLLGQTGTRYQAAQSAFARYSRTGFEAAAVSGFAVAMSAQVPRQGVIRTAELRFARPFAVVAVATGEIDRPGAPGGGPWDGLPVFSAWITDPEDAVRPGDPSPSVPV